MNIALIDAVGVSRSAVLTVAEAEGAVTVGPWAFVGLAVAIAVLIFLVLRTKIHALLALVIAASIAGLSAGMSPEDTVGSISSGFGSTLATIGFVVGFGVMMGAILEASGAAESSRLPCCAGSASARKSGRSRSRATSCRFRSSSTARSLS